MTPHELKRLNRELNLLSILGNTLDACAVQGRVTKQEIETMDFLPRMGIAPPPESAQYGPIHLSDVYSNDPWDHYVEALHRACASELDFNQQMPDDGLNALRAFYSHLIEACRQAVETAIETIEHRWGLKPPTREKMVHLLDGAKKKNLKRWKQTEDSAKLPAARWMLLVIMTYCQRGRLTTDEGFNLLVKLRDWCSSIDIQSTGSPVACEQFAERFAGLLVEYKPPTFSLKSLLSDTPPKLSLVPLAA